MSFMHKILKRIKAMGNYKYVLMVWLLCAIYYGFIASPRYVPEAQVYVKSAKSMTLEDAMPSISLMGSISKASNDVILLQNYLHSKDLLDMADAELNVKAHYSAPTVDFISRLKPWASDEDFLAYYRSRVKLSVDAESGILFIQAEGFTRDYAVKLTNFLLKQGEAYINKVGQDVAKAEVKFVQQEVDRASAKLEAAKKELLDFSNQFKTLSPQEEGAAYAKIITEMKAEMVKSEAELKTLSSFMNDGTAEVEAIKSKIDALKKQIALEEERSTREGENSLGRQNALYQALVLKVEFATQVYSTTITALEQTRVEAYRQLKHLVLVQKPSLPDEAKYPRTLHNLLTILAVLTIVYGIIVLIAATIKEHKHA